ncbi:hypothetical protein GOY07_03520 [Wolbachia endosymbiont of Litomosoides sigmodontis]|uniref:hypothetical protein n=1 Tax=Wolbachia endosymbiont of Litomosoides sigmodontis TaxID=80850 RepID=UPI00158EF8A9|nr:hypothetical protein [Wolbachia endosymbiont of Litomosoides sigmodontis]QKX03213.1 hypothetical protein GOY07_03520 [Wolbachia endosymbiont of Litomosoides sigmodontis]
MESVRLNFLLILFLTFYLSCQVYADCPPFVESNTKFEAGGRKALEGFAKIFSLGTAGSFRIDEESYQYITVRQVRDQGIDGYFNPKIQVCDYGGKNNCYILTSGTSCHQIYGTQSTGAGVSAAVFIDWEGDKMLASGTIQADSSKKIKEGIAKGLEWEWADNVTDEEKVKFANSPKICACSQKGACMSGISSWGARVFLGGNIFRPGEMEKACDTCSSWSQGKQKIKCAPIPLAPGPLPFCEQLGMFSPQVKIVPITDKDNDYFNPRVRVIIDKLGKKDLNFQRTSHEIEDDRGTTHYFKTYRKRGKLCAEYYGTQNIDKENLQSVRCFPAPPAPEPERVEIVDENTLEVKMKMSANTFYVNTDSLTNIGPLSLKVVKPRIVKKTTNGNNNKGNITDIVESILKKNPQFKILEKYGLTPNIGIRFSDGKDYSITNSTKNNEIGPTKWELDDMGQPKIKVRYMRVRDQGDSNNKMLCLSGWKAEPEEFVLEKDGEIVLLKSIGARYIKYNAVYSMESNQFYYLPSKKREIVDLLKRPQKQLDEMIFDKQGYIFFPEENEQEKKKCSYCVKRDDEIDKAFASDKGLRIVYKLVDLEQYLNKEDGNPFYLRYEEVDCKDKDGKTLRNEKNEIQKCTQLKDRPIKADRTEVFYADKLCRLDLESVKKKVLDTINKRLKSRNLPQAYIFSSDDNYTDDLSKYDSIEIEAWGGGEAGHIKNTAHSTESRLGMPGDYIKVQLKIDPNYPIIRAQATEGGGGLTNNISNKDGGPTFIKMCKDSSEVNCKDLITVAGGGKHRIYGGKEYKKTKVHDNLGNLEILGNPTVVTGKDFTEDNQVAYIEDGKVKYEIVKCSSDFKSSNPGAGGCIDNTNQVYSRGSPGYVIIKSVQVDDKEVEKIVNALVGQNSNASISNLIGKFYSNLTREIEEEIKKKLLGL